jgi:uncharacterized protein (DUF608 family)
MINNITKEEALDLIKLLSAMESWSMMCSQQNRLPDYLHDALSNSLKLLTDVVLGGKEHVS